MRQATFLLLMLLFPLVAADDDGDPVGDDAEALVCGFPDVRAALELLGGAAGECTAAPDFDYSHPVFGSGPVCTGPQCEAEFVVLHDLGTPPQDVEGQGPFPVQEIDEDLATVEGHKGAGQDYCLHIVPAFGGDPGPLCLDVGPAQPFLQDTGVIDLVHVPGASVGPTPGHHVEATSMEVTMTVHWDASRLNDRVAFQGTEVWEPVDMDDQAEVLWWVDHPAETRVDLHVSWKDETGDTLHEDTYEIPYLGQAMASLARTP